MVLVKHRQGFVKIIHKGRGINYEFKEADKPIEMKEEHAKFLAETNSLIEIVKEKKRGG